MKLERRFFVRYDEPNDREYFAYFWIIRNEGSNEDKNITVIQHSGIFNHEMGEHPYFRIVGGDLKVYPNQTSKQLENRLKTYLRAYDSRWSLTEELSVAEFTKKAEVSFGKVRAAPMVKAAELNLHYMKRADESMVMEGEDFNIDEVVQSASIEREEKPAEWGSW